jgi:peptide methionine sulfoxide reductase MsrB
MAYNQLTPEEEYIILHKGTERPFTGELLNNKAEGVCMQTLRYAACTHPNQNLSRIAAGQVLMMRYPAR